MHAVTLLCYGMTIWFAMLLFSAITMEHTMAVFLSGPLIVSGSAGGLLLLDWLITYFFDRQSAPDKRPSD